MKKLINEPRAVVQEMLEGLAKANPQIIYVRGLEVICRRQPVADKVGVISGGGSGREPAHTGFVGDGLLDAAAAGNVFASPSPDRILEALKRADTGRGVLMVVKNYSGDIMNFELASELAGMEEIQTAMVVVKDDVAVPDSTYSTGRRGIAGTVFVHKIAGAAALRGDSLDQVQALAQLACDKVRSVGMATGPCMLPGADKPNFTLAEDEVELGMGIHGEPGVRRTKPQSAARTARALLDRVLDDLDYDGSQVAVLMNGLGATPLMELYILYNEVETLLRQRGLTVYRALVGNYMTSLEMAGCTLTLLRLDEVLIPLLDAPCVAPAWQQT